MQKRWLVLVFAAVLLLTIALLYKEPQKENYSNIKSFEDCAVAGFPIMESYPRQCRAGNGTVFTEVISEE